MSKPRSRLGTAIDYYAVPAAAAAVGWIVAMRFVVPHAPAAIADSALGAVAVQSLVALASFALARRYL
jgi:hypothetical protein